jgi:hypothetical protein
MKFLKYLSASKQSSQHDLDDIIKTSFIDFTQYKLNGVYESPLDNLKFLRSYKHEKTLDNILFYAARHANLNLMKLLFEYNFDFGHTNSDGKTLLHEVIYFWSRQSDFVSTVLYLSERLVKLKIWIVSCFWWKK